MRRDERSDTDLVLAARADDPAAFGHLFDRWYERSWNVARTILRDDDLAADVAQDALVVAWQQLDQLRNPDAFGGWLLRSTRNRALTRLARERRSTASGDEVVSGLRDRGQNDPTAAEPLPQPDAVNEIRDRQELVWAAAAALGEGDASLLDLHLRHGLTPAEIAEELGVAANAAHQQLFRLRGRLGDAIGSYLLWRNGRPLCEGLAAAVSGRKAFNKSVARAVRKHQASCEQCSEERAALVDPHKLFAAAPLVVVPAGLKAQAAAALEAAGVPMAGATGGSAPDGTGADSGTSTDGGTGADSGTGADGETGADGGSDAGAEADAPGNTADASGNGSDGSGSEVANTDGADSAGGQGNGAEAGGQAGGGMPNPAPPPTTPPPTPPVLLPSGGPVLLSAPGRGLSARTLSRREILVGAGAGLLTLAILFGMASLVLDSGNGMDLLAGLESSSADEPLAAGQQGNGEQDPSGPASFSRDSARPGEPEATPTTVRSTTRASRPTTSVGTSSTTSTTVDTTSTTVESTTTSSSTTSTTRSTTTSSSTTSTTRDTTTSSSSTTSTTRDTTTSSSTTSSTAPPVDPPTFDRASVSPNPSGTCQTPSETPKKVSWAASGATSVSVSGGGISQTGGASGSIPFCAIGTVSISLTAEGPGGRTSTSASG